MIANTAKGAPDPKMYAPIQSKEQLCLLIRDNLPGANESLRQDLLRRISASNTCTWHDPCYVAS